jgi:SAM-dependent methyltransferase
VMLRHAPAASGLEMAAENPGTAALEGGADPVSLGRRVWWVLLAFAPSSLLLGVTTYLSTDIASVPLLWVIPLAIYLLTFVLVFARRPILPHRFMLWLQPFLVIPLALLFFLNIKSPWPFFPLHLLAFFIIAMVCHGELMKDRPAAAHLTEFYLWMSVGGVLGGLFNALVAPATFNAVIEYPLMIVVACLLRPYLTPTSPRSYSRVLDFLLPLGLAVLLGGLSRVIMKGSDRWQLLGVLFLSCLAAVFCYGFRHRPGRFGLGVGAIMLASVLLPVGQNRIICQERNFFGVLKVFRYERYHLLTHGTTLHGAQSLDPARRREPITYYHRTGPLGQMFAAFSGKDARWRIGIVGLGTGTVACYGKAGQQLTFYEIDPAVERVALDGAFFTYLRDCHAQVRVVLGDARLSLQKAKDAYFDMMILDAFSSDAIPLHLVTREALRLYLAKLREGGVLAFHITNRSLDLRPVVGNLARDAGLACLVQEDMNLSKAEKKAGKYKSIWAVMGPWDSLKGLAADPRWHKAPDPGKPLWTDDFSNILEVFKWRNWRLN